MMKMKAAVRTEYGPPEVLNIQEIEKPKPGEKEILIKVYATTVNRTDCGILWGKPAIIRLFTGLSKPRLTIPGTDFAGIVEEIGKEVKQFRVGDKVWGFDDSGLESNAEFMVLHEDKYVLTIPDNLTFEQAAASAEGAHYAYNFIKKVKIIEGQRVLVNGATGAIGSAAVQILKTFNVWITATCNTKNVNLVESLGADKIVDYAKEDFTKDDEKYDYVFDCVGKSTFGKCKPLLKKGGIYISSELGPNNENVFFALTTPLFGNKKVIFPFPTNIKGTLLFIKDLLEQKKFLPVIDKSYPLEKIAEAYSYVDSGQKTGNVILKINASSER